MSLELCILASGSSGNAALLRSPAGVMLIDLGIGPRALATRLDGTGVRLADLHAACLTHLDIDHFRPHWANSLIRHNIALHCHRDRRDYLLGVVDPEFRPGVESALHTFDGQPFSPLPGLSFTPVALAHDQAGSHAFLIEGFGMRIGYATDLGRVPPALLEQFRQLNLLAIESNYDPAMQLASTRPAFLKTRIMGGQGHLSNQQAFDAVRAILDRHQSAGQRLPDHVVLLHRSRQCNCPNLLRMLFSQDPRIPPRLTIAQQYQRTDWLRPRTLPPAPGEQLTLAWE